MAVLEIVTLDEGTPQLIVPQAGDTYILPRATTTPAQITSTLATGTAPLVIASTTKVDNLHVARATLGDTVTTNANLTGHVTSTGNAAILGSFTKAQLDTAVSDGNVLYTGDAIMATDPIWDAAGDIVQGTGANTAARLALGTANQLLRVNAGATALEYYTPSASGDFKADGTVDMTGQFRTDVGTFDSDVVNGATANAYTFDTQNTYSTAGANLLRLSNNATVVMDVSFQGGIDHVNSGASTAAHSQSLNLNWLAGGTQTSSGQYSCVIGQQSKATALNSFAAGGVCQATANYSTAFGEVCNATGTAAFSAGSYNTASGSWATAFGASNTVSGYASLGTGRGLNLDTSNSIAIGNQIAASGDAQGQISVVRVATTNATQTTLALYVGDFVIPADTTWAFSALIVARSDEADGNEQAVWEIKGCLGRDESNNTALVGTPVVTQLAASTNALADAWAVVAEADDTNEALAIKVTGFAATNIRWVAKVDISQVTFA